MRVVNNLTGNEILLTTPKRGKTRVFSSATAHADMEIREAISHIQDKARALIKRASL